MCVTNGEIKVNPSQVDLQAAELTLLYVGTEKRTLTVEAHARGAGVSNAQFAEALRVAHTNVREPPPIRERLRKPARAVAAVATALIYCRRQAVISRRAAGGTMQQTTTHPAAITSHAPPTRPQAVLMLEPQRQLAAIAGAPKRKVRLTVPSPDLLRRGTEAAGSAIKDAFRKGAAMGKRARGDEVRFAKAQLTTGLASKGATLLPVMLNALFDDLARAEMRRLALDEGLRMDGRALDELRAVTCESGVVPRVHGSSIFERGETQALVTVTVGAVEEAQKTEDLVRDPQWPTLPRTHLPRRRL